MNFFADFVDWVLSGEHEDVSREAYEEAKSDFEEKLFGQSDPNSEWFEGGN